MKRFILPCLVFAAACSTPPASVTLPATYQGNWQVRIAQIDSTTATNDLSLLLLALVAGDSTAFPARLSVTDKTLTLSFQDGTADKPASYSLLSQREEGATLLINAPKPDTLYLHFNTPARDTLFIKAGAITYSATR